MKKLKIVVCFSKKVSKPEISRAKKMGMDIAELRVDFLKSADPAELVRQIKMFRGTPVLLTIRSAHEGGLWKSSDEARLDLYELLIPYVDMVDIELSSDKILKSVLTCAKKYKKTRIVSFHDFEHMPTAKAMKQIKLLAKKAGADLVKIAAKANSSEDLKIMALFTLENSSEDLITIAMGEHGKSSRILCPLLGSQMAYTFLGKPTAPGQIGLKTLKKYFN